MNITPGKVAEIITADIVGDLAAAIEQAAQASAEHGRGSVVSLVVKIKHDTDNTALLMASHQIKRRQPTDGNEDRTRWTDKADLCAWDCNEAQGQERLQMGGE